MSQIYAKFVTKIITVMTAKSNITTGSSTEKKILIKIKNHNRGTLFFPDDFTGTGSADAIRQVLHRLDKVGILVRIAHGIYLYPKKDKDLGILYPPVEVIAKAIAKRDKARIVPTGVFALNRLGLSSQVPMKVVYLTNGSPRIIKIGKRTIKFKITTPKNLMAKGEISSLVIQALREIGKDNATGEQLNKINDLLKNESPENLLHDIRIAPVWIAKILMKAIKNPVVK
jgi:hypothetical protein